MTVYDIVTDFGAVGDDSTDCSTAFINAGNAMAADPGSDLVIPAGTFKFVSNPSAISGRTIQYWAKGVQGRILGAGIGTTTLNLNGRALGTGAIGVYHDGNHFGAIQSVTAGANQVQFVAAAKTVTISAASPGVVTLASHGWAANEPIVFYNSGGALPAAITAGTIYYIKTVLNSNTFTISATPGGTAINTASTGTGTHSVTIFTPGRWVLVCGLNQQDLYSDVPGTGYGYPPNFAVMEYAQISVITSGGLITLSAPLQKTYLSTWPHLNDGNAFETTAAGEAGLHLLDVDWAADIEVHDLTVTSTGNQLYAGCHSAIFQNVNFPSASAVIPSQNKYFKFDNVTTVVETEVDKLVEKFEVVNSNIYRLTFQSATMNEFNADNSNIGYTAELTVTATTSIGNPTVTFGGGVPTWISGFDLLYTSVVGQFGNVSVSSKTGTTITFSGNALKTVNIGDKFGFTRGGLNGAGQKTTITNSKLAVCQPGANSYGVCPDPFTISNSEVWNWGQGGYAEFAEAHGTMSGGVIAIPNGTSCSNVVDNGSGKARYTVTSTAGLTAGKYIVSSPVYQELTATATTSIGSPTVTFGGGVPTWIAPGQTLNYHTGSNKFSSGTTVLSKTSTTITFSTNALVAVSIGNVFGFAAAALTGNGFASPPGDDILAVIDETTVDMDLNFPSGFVYAGGGKLGFIQCIRWARPGTYMYWRGSLGEVGKFKVLGVTQDATRTYIQTDQPGGFPTLPALATGLALQTASAQTVRASALTGPTYTAKTGATPFAYNASVMDAKAYNKPLGSFAKATYTGSDSAGLQKPIGKCFGNLVSITIDVVQAYTGSLFANLFLQLSQFPNLKFVVDGASTDLGWGIDVKTTGTRIITPANTVSNATKKPNDSNLLVPSWSDHIWMISSPQLSFQTTSGTNGTLRDISSEASNLWPIVNVEILTDQGFQLIPTAVAPLRLRLRA